MAEFKKIPIVPAPSHIEPWVEAAFGGPLNPSREDYLRDPSQELADLEAELETLLKANADSKIALQALETNDRRITILREKIKALKAKMR